jgi:NADH-quinone oxidoreductase subunit A
MLHLIKIIFWLQKLKFNILLAILLKIRFGLNEQNFASLRFFPVLTLTTFEQQLSTLEKIEYFKVFNLFTIIFVISLLLFGIAYFLSLSTIKDSEKLSQYECGFEPFDEATRHPFDVHFYIVGILFLIFDVEIALLFPWVLGLKASNWFGFFTMVIFLGVLTIGFFYEWHRGALAWPHKQINQQ